MPSNIQYGLSFLSFSLHEPLIKDLRYTVWSLDHRAFLLIMD